MLRKKQSKRSLVSAPEEFSFWVCDGKLLRNLVDLKKALAEISADTFRYHVNSQKNDFAKWINEVLGDGQLAKQMADCKTKESCLKKVEGGLNKYY